MISSIDCCSSCRRQSSPETSASTDDFGCAVFSRKSSSAAMGRSGDCSCRHWDAVQQHVFTLPPPPSPPIDSSDSFHVFHFPSVIDSQPTLNGTLSIDRNPSTIPLRLSAHSTTSVTTTTTLTTSDQKTSAVCDSDDDEDDDDGVKDNHLRHHRSHSHHRDNTCGGGVVAIATGYRKSSSYSAPPPPLPPHSLVLPSPPPPQSIINSRDSRSRRVHFAGHIS